MLTLSKLKNYIYLTVSLVFISYHGHSQSTNPFLGTWKGSYSCYPQGEKGLTLVIKQIDSKIIITSYTYPLPSNPNLPSAIIESDGYIQGNKLVGKNPRWIKRYRWAMLNEETEPIVWVKENDYLYYSVCGNPVMLTRTNINSALKTENSFEKVPRHYDRTSLTVLFLDFSEPNFDEVRNVIQKIKFSEKYDYNNLSSPFIKPSFRRQSFSSDLQILLFHEFNKLKLGNQILAKWYDRKPDGTMSLGLIHQRGRFTSTDQHYSIAQSLKRGNSALEDYGERLINLSYILVIDMQNVRRNPNSTSTTNLGWQADAVGYIYRINYDENARKTFYDSWIQLNDDKKIREEKNKIFDSNFIPITFVDKFVIEQVEDRKGFNESANLQTLVEIAYRELIHKAEVMIGDFKVKTPLYSTNPLRAKIGLKEGLKADDRFFVYEHTLDVLNGITDVKRVGVTRSTGNISDNRHEAKGGMESTKFYQISGSRLKSGMILQQANDIGLEVSVLRSLGAIEGTNYRFDYRLGRHLGIRSTFVILEFGFQSKQYSEANTILGYSSTKFSFFRLEQGLAKGFQMSRNIELRPFLNYGFEFTNNKEIPNDYNVGAFYLRPGAYLSLNIRHYFQLVGGWNYYFISGWFLDQADNEVVPWSDIFVGREGNAFSFGFKLMM